MKFNPSTRELFTDQGELIKVLRCPLRMTWEQLRDVPASPHRMCCKCDHPVLDTATMSDSEVVATVRANPGTCVSVRASQANLTLLLSTRADPQASGRDLNTGG